MHSGLISLMMPLSIVSISSLSLHTILFLTSVSSCQNGGSSAIKEYKTTIILTSRVAASASPSAASASQTLTLQQPSPPPPDHLLAKGKGKAKGKGEENDKGAGKDKGKGKDKGAGKDKDDEHGKGKRAMEELDFRSWKSWKVCILGTLF